MASSLLEIFVPALHAIPLPDEKTDKILKTGMSQFKTSYIEQLPHQFPHSYNNESRQVVLLKLDSLFCVYYRKGLHLYVV